jgi:hypothetical protein
MIHVSTGGLRKAVDSTDLAGDRQRRSQTRRVRGIIGSHCLHDSLMRNVKLHLHGRCPGQCEWQPAKTVSLRDPPDAEPRKVSRGPDAMLVMPLEEYDEASGTANKSTIMKKDVVGKPPPVTSVNTAEEGLLVSLNERGKIDLPFMASIYRKP